MRQFILFSRQYLALFAALLASLFIVSNAAALTTPNDEQVRQNNFFRFIQWFAGEYDNNEQVWQQKNDADDKKLDKIDDPIPHTHHIFAPVVAPKIGDHVYYVQQSQAPDFTKPYRQRIYRLSNDVQENAIKLEIFTPLDEKAFVNAHLNTALFTSLELSALKAAPGCEVYWRYSPAETEFIGTMKKDACSFVSQRSGKKIFVTDTLKLTPNEIWINDQARDEAGNYVFGSKTNTPIKNRKVRYFTGWMYMNRAGIHAPKEQPKAEQKFSFRRDLLIHTEGQYVPLLWDDGTETPYLIQLANLTYQNTKTPILKLALVDKATMKSIFYIWTEPEGTRIGLNMTWLQVGLTQKKDRANFGFDFPSAKGNTGVSDAPK